MIRKIPAAIVALFLLTCNLPAAEVVRGKWQKVENLAAGSPITIKTHPGEQVKCTYFSSDRETLLVVEISGRQRRIPKSIIESVIAEKYEDRLINGALIGLSGGAAFAALLATVPRDMSHRNRVTVGIFGAVLFGMMGMGIGALVDYHHQGRETIYLAATKKN